MLRYWSRMICVYMSLFLKSCGCILYFCKQFAQPPAIPHKDMTVNTSGYTCGSKSGTEPLWSLISQIKHQWGLWTVCLGLSYMTKHRSKNLSTDSSLPVFIKYDGFGFRFTYSCCICISTIFHRFKEEKKKEFLQSCTLYLFSPAIICDDWHLVFASDRIFRENFQQSGLSFKSNFTLTGLLRDCWMELFRYLAPAIEIEIHSDAHPK